MFRKIGLLSLGLALAFASGAQAALTLNYQFDEAAGAPQDSSGNGYHGTLQNAGSLQQNQLGRYAGSIAIHLNGNGSDAHVATGQNYTTLGFSDGTNGNTVESYTAMAWVRLDSPAGVSGDNMIFGSPNGGDPLHLGFRNTDFHFGHWGQDSNTAGGAAANTWYHMTYRYTGGVQGIFVNGVLVAPAGSPIQGDLNFNNAVTIGRSDNGGDLAGFLDEVGVFNTGLSNQEITAAFFAGQGTTFQYDMDEINQLFNLFTAGSGSVTIDGLRWTNNPAAGANTFLANPAMGQSGGSLVLGAGGAGLSATNITPEPGTIAMFGLVSLAAAGFAVRRRKLMKK